jgi:hypothetical protein
MIGVRQLARSSGRCEIALSFGRPVARRAAPPTPTRHTAYVPARAAFGEGQLGPACAPRPAIAT